MKITIGTVLVVLAFIGVGQSEPVCPMGEGWEFDQQFSDEFNGQELDGQKWWDFNPEWYGRKPGYFSRENVTVKDGKLCLTAKVQKPEEVTVENKVRGYDKFTTSTVKSKKRILYGYFEARCKSMKASVCNAFWLYDPLNPPAKYKEGSFSEEIDIFEIFGKPAKKEYDRVYCTTVHRFYTPYVESIANAKQTPLPKKGMKQKVPFDFHADFHVYGFLWTPTEMKWFVDGKEVFARDNDYYHAALYIMFDCEIMKDWVGLPDPADLPSTFEIDYLRVWKHKDQPFPMAKGF
ncbi:MAG: family 16 glycosylhydrolase [Kiritimatiellae bacterium]|nr:family 16 glycosylhydrolase [Kiritimatiellia bacterium]MDD5519315.1 family 16 glycosylhydrolase [Kiritimatiellia bacterium]